MKKSLIALAVLGFSGMAMAQSSVTLYGVADAGYARTQTVNPDGSKTSFNGMTSAGLMNNGTSRFGVRGTEDMGGGLKAGFNFEGGLSLTDGSANKSGGNFWSREANVWLGGNWGRFKMGRDLNPSFFAVAQWDLTQTANYSAVDNTYNFSSPDGPRTSGMFAYTTPNFSGLSATLAFVPKNTRAATTNPADNNTKWDLNVLYGNGPISAGLGVNKVSQQKTNYTLGGKYTFGGQFALAASYNTLSVANLSRRGFSLGGSYFTGPFTLTLDVVRDIKNELGPKKYTNATLEGKYALSKRTFVYAAFLRLDSTNNYGIGLRHNF